MQLHKNDEFLHEAWLVRWPEHPMTIRFRRCTSQWEPQYSTTYCAVLAGEQSSTFEKTFLNKYLTPITLLTLTLARKHHLTTSSTPNHDWLFTRNIRFSTISAGCLIKKRKRHLFNAINHSNHYMTIPAYNEDIHAPTYQASAPPLDESTINNLSGIPVAVASPLATADLSSLPMAMATPINDEEVARPSSKSTHQHDFVTPSRFKAKKTQQAITANSRSVVAVSSSRRRKNSSSSSSSNNNYYCSCAGCALFFFTFIAVIAVAVHFSKTDDTFPQTSSSSVPSVTVDPEPEVPTQSPSELAQEVWNDHAQDIEFMLSWYPSDGYGQCISNPGFFLALSFFREMGEIMIRVFQDSRLTIAVEENMIINSSNETLSYYDTDTSNCIRMQDFSETVMEESVLVEANLANRLTQSRLAWLDRVGSTR